MTDQRTNAAEDLSVHVLSFDYQPLQQAEVTTERDGRTIATRTTDDRGWCQVPTDDAGDLVVRVSASGYAQEERVVTGYRTGNVELFMLGRPGMPYYYRGKVRVPFEPVTDAVGVLVRAAEGRSEEDIAAQGERIAKRLGLHVIRSHPNFIRSRIVVLGIPADSSVESTEAIINRLARSREVEHAGALVKLFDDHASFLTNIVIARFAEGLEDATVAAIASNHGLSSGGRITALGNVHRLRLSGPATYAVLASSNGLAEEPQVVYAEPDLVHTEEEDAVIPTDFLFPQQWDHPIVDTPDAWQALRNISTSRTFGSPEVIIAVVDSGVDATHPEFAGNVSNGQAKLYQAFDFVNMVANMNNLGGDHGTACASAATANTNNASAVAGVSEGVAGVAGNCRLIAVRRSGPESRYAEIYLWAAGFDANSPTAGFPPQITPGADVISSSFGASIGSPISGLMSDTFDTLTDDGRDGEGTLLFFSAGNINSDLDLTFARPWGMYDRCFCVAASTLDNNGVTEIKAGYSSFGSTVDFCAPSNDNDGIHNPPTAYGAHTATIQAAPDGDAIPGRPDQRTALTGAAAVGIATLTVATTAGMAVGQAVLIGAPGAAGTENRRITAVIAGANQLTVTPALMVAHGVGTAIASGPWSYQSGFGGTSYATPVCAGTGALMLSANPELRWDQVRDILRETAVKIDQNNADPTGRWRDGGGLISTDPGYAGPLFSEFYGYGRIDAAAAVRRAGWAAVVVADNGDFGEVCVGSFVDRELIINNRGRRPLRIFSVTSTRPQFVVPMVISYPLVVAAGGSIELPIRFQPSGQGTATATLTILSNDPASPATVDVRGTAPPPRLTLSIADSGNFGDTCVGSFHDQLLTLANSAHCPLTITSITSSSAEFLVPYVDAFPLAIAPGTTAEVTLRFQPDSSGAKSATITVTSDDPTGPRLLPVSGYAPSGTLAVTGTTDFGGAELGQRVQQTLSVCNVGNCDLHVTKVAFKPACRSDSVCHGGCHHSGHGDNCGNGYGHHADDNEHYHDEDKERSKDHRQKCRCDQRCLNFTIVCNPFPATLRPGSCLGVVVEFVAICNTAPCCELVIESDEPQTPTRTLFLTGHLRPTLRSALKCWAAQQFHDIIQIRNY